MFGKQSVYHVNGVNINVVEAGEGSPALLFLHYWGGSGRTWGPVIEKLSATNRCIAIDFRGWGESSREAGDYRLETLADDVIGTIGELNLKDFVVIGHSMGGKVAQLVAAQHPAGLKRLILIAPAPPTALHIPKEERDGMIASYMTPKGTEKVMSIFLSMPQADASRERIIAYREQIIADTLSGAPDAKRAWPGEGMIEDISERASRIAVPVRIIVGSADTVETEASLRAAFRKVIPDIHFMVLPGIGHLSPIEATGEVADAIRSLLLD